MAIVDIHDGTVRNFKRCNFSLDEELGDVSDESDNDARIKKSEANDDFSDTDSDDAENENEN